MRTFTVEEISQIVGGMLTKAADVQISQIAPPLLADENTLALALGEEEIANLANHRQKLHLCHWAFKLTASLQSKLKDQD